MEAELAGKRIVMTGATGFIGRNVAAMLLAEGARVYALVRPDSPNQKLLPEMPGLCRIFGSMGDMPDVQGLPETADGFLHFAWGGVNREEIDSPKVQAANVSASLGCLEAARRMKCRIFMDAGSRVEYGITENGAMEESMECRPVNAYGKAKLEFYWKAAEICREQRMTYYHLRFFSVYGPGDHPWSIISTLTRELPKGGAVSLSACRHRWNFMDISDASRAVTELYRHSAGREGQIHVVNVAGRDTRELRSFVEEIHEICGRKGSLEYGTFVQAKEGALSVCPVTDVLAELTDGEWKEETTFAEGIRKILEMEGNTV